MKFLIYGLNFSPELVGIGKYTGELAETLVKKGHHITVVTTPPYYPAWRVGQGYRASRYNVEETPNLKVIRCPLWVPRRVSGLKRILHLLSYAFSSKAIIRHEARQKPDLIFTVAPTLLAAPAAARAGKQLGIPTWLHIQDFEIEAARNLGILNAGSASPFFGFLPKMESKLFKRFDRVSSISTKMVEKLQDKGVANERCVYFPNWVDTNVIHPLDGTSEYRTLLGLKPDCTVMLYSGSISVKQGLEVILDSAHELRGKPGIHFVVCGEGPAKHDLQHAAQRLENIHFLPLQPGEKLNQLLNLADIHLLPQKQEAADLVMPSKLLGMLASGKPVIAGCTTGSELFNSVSETGVAIEPENGNALTVAIKTLARDPIKRMELGVKGRQYVIEHFSKEKVIDQFVRDAESLTTAYNSSHHANLKN